MLRVIVGRSGSGRSTLIYEEIAAHAAQGEEGMLLLVPEQYAFNAECELARIAGNSVSLHGEVMSFKGLARRVFAETGGAPASVDEGGRLLAMYQAQLQVRPRLRVYASRSGPDMTAKLLSAVNEFKSYCVTPDELAVAPDERGGLADKLHDLSLIYGAYDALMSGDLGDPADVMTRLFERLGTSDYLRGRRIYVDGFVGFTPAELRILGRCAESAAEVTVTLCMDPESSEEDDVFFHSRQTLDGLRALTHDLRVETAGDGLCRRFDAPSSDLAFLERAVFDYGAAPRRTPGDGSVSLVCAPSEYIEYELAAARIRRLVMEEGLRYRDIAVVVPQNGFSAAVTVFEKYGIPTFGDRTESVLCRTPVRAVCAAVEAVAGGFSCEACIRLAKTGLVGLDGDEADELEGYASMWNVNGRRWYAEEGFTMHPDGFGEKFTEETRARLDRLELLRKKLITPLLKLKEGLSGRNALEMTRAVCTYLQDVDFAGHVGKRRADLVRVGSVGIAQEYSQLVEVIFTALEQFALIMGESPLSPEEYAPLLKIILSGSKVGVIPTAMDAVAVGISERVRFIRPRVVFVLGATEGVFPPAPVDSGLLTSADRKTLFEDRNIRLAPDSVDQVRRGMLTAYRVLAAPSEKLYLSWPASAADGSKVSPSHLCLRIRSLLPEVALERPDEQRAEWRTWAPVPCAELGATAKGFAPGSSLARAAETVAKRDPVGSRFMGLADTANVPSRGPLRDREVIRGLYRDRPTVTVSRLELFNTCRFAFFARYGLKIEPPKKAELEPRLIGTFVHYVLEKTAGRISSLPGDPWSTVTREEARAFADEYIEEYAREQMGDREDSSARIRWLFSRLKSRIYAMTDSLVEEFAASEFRPLCFEYDFRGESLKMGDVEVPLSGTADRVDYWDCDGTRYIRIVDYKTGEKRFDYSDISAGLGIQLLLYLFVLTGEGSAPAGVLYVPSLKKVKTVRPGEGPDGKTGRTGIVLDDPRVLSAMEKLPEGELKARFIPVSYSAKDGSPRSNYLVSEGQLEKLRDHVGGVLGGMYRALLSGELECDPYGEGMTTSCDRCDYRAVCQFDPGRKGDRYRTLKKVKAEEFYGSEVSPE